jgi:glucose/arabinose dehydrogenase
MIGMRHIASMSSLTRTSILFAAFVTFVPLGLRAQQTAPPLPLGAEVAKQLPPPDPSKAGTRFAKIVGWPAGTAPRVTAGFTVTLFAGNLSSPRGLHVLPNGDVLVAESQGEPSKSPNKVTLLRDADHDGRAEMRTPLLERVRQPFGLLLSGDQLYVGNTNALVRFPYRAGDTRITASATKVLDLPAGGYNNHWTRNVVANADGSKLFVSVGSGTNVDEEKEDQKDPRRAAVLEVNPDGTGMRVYAGGLRNPVGLALEPETKVLWTVVNERDMLGDELVPDYLTSVKEGAFYGWPFAYFGPIEDPRKKGERPDLVAKTIPPDYSLGAHVAPLSIAFYTGTSFPARYRNGAFVSLHGSWNRSQFSGYKVVFVPFQQGRPSAAAEDFLTGFIQDENASTVHGRPVGLALLQDGSLLVADDGANCVWRVSAGK